MTERLRKSLRWLAILLIFGAIAGAVALYTKSHQKTTLTIGIYAGSSWDVPKADDYQIIDTAIKRFEKEHPKVEVVYESGISKADYADWLTDKIVSGEQPDVFMVPEDDFNLLSSTGALADLNTQFTPSFDQTIFYPSAYQSGQYRNIQYALPFESNPMMMCINIDLLKKEGIALPESGWTIEDFYEICQQVTKDTDGDGALDQYGVTGYQWQEAVAAYGAKLFSNDGSQAHFDSDAVKQALSMMTKLKNLTGNYTVSSKDFDEGKVAFMPMTLAEYRTYQPYPYHVAKYSTFTWSCVTMPASQENGEATQLATSLFAISSRSHYQDLAWDLLRLLCADEKTQQTVFDDSQGTSVLKSVMTSSSTEQKLKDDGFGSSSLTTSTLNSMLSRGITEPTFKTYNKVMEQADYLITKAISNNSIDSELFTIQKILQDSLQNN